MVGARGIRLVADAWGVSVRQAERILNDMGGWATKRADLAIDQPSRAAGRFGSGAAGPIGGGLKTGGLAIGGGTAVYGGSQFYASHTERQTASEENAIDQQRVDAMTALLTDPSKSEAEKRDLIRALDDANFFRDTDITPETWLEKLGVTPGSLNPVQFFGGGLSGLVVFLIIVWALVKMAGGS